MAFTTSESMKMIILQAEIDGALKDAMVRSHVDNIVYEEDGNQIALSEKLASILSEIALRAKSTDVTAEIKTATDEVYNKIMGITAEDGTTVDQAYDTLKEVAAYLNDHGDVVTGINANITELQNAIEALETGMTKVEESTTNGNIKVDGEEINVYTHPETHSADMITDTATKVMMTAAERAKLGAVSANASAIVTGAGSVAEATPVGTLMMKVIDNQ